MKVGVSLVFGVINKHNVNETGVVMKKSIFAIFLFFVCPFSAFAGVTWTDWQPVDGVNPTGQINISGGPVGVIYDGDYFNVLSGNAAPVRFDYDA